MRNILSYISMSLSIFLLWSCSQNGDYSKYNKIDLDRADIPLPSLSAYKSFHRFEKTESLGARKGQVYKFVSEVALADFQYAVSRFLVNNNHLKVKNGYPDYSQYFYNSKRKSLGKEYSDFLCNIVWKYFNDRGIRTTNKNDIIKPDSIAKFLAFYNKRQNKFVSDLWQNLRIPDKLNVNYIDKRYEKVFSKKVLDAMFNAKVVYPNDNYLGHWQALVGFAPSAIKLRAGWAEQSFPSYNSPSSSWYEIYYTDTDTRHSDSTLSSFMQVQCFGEDLVPVVVGLKNPVYNIDVHRDL